MRWYDWLFRAHDPEARRMIGEVINRLDRFVVDQGFLRWSPSSGMYDLHCGHRAVQFAVYRDGTTTCYECYDPGRGNPVGAI